MGIKLALKVTLVAASKRAMEHLVNRKRMKTGIRTNNWHASEIGVDWFGEPRTAAARRTVARPKINQVRIRVIPNAIPEQLILIMNKGILIHRIVMRQGTLLNSDRELIKNHVIPIFPVKRRAISTVSKADTRNV